MPSFTSNLGATAGSGQNVDYNGNSYTQDGTADPDYFSVNRSAYASNGGSASLIGNSVTLNGTGGDDQFYVYLDANAQSGGQAVSSGNIVAINGGDGNDGRYDYYYYYQSQSYDRAIANGTGSSATSSSNQLVYSGGAGDDFHYHYSYGEAYNGGTVVISGSVAQLSGGDGADYLLAQRWVNAYGAGSMASLTDTEFAVSGGTDGDQLQSYVGGHAGNGGVVTVTGNNTSLFGDAGYDSLYGGIYAGAYGTASSTLTSGNTLAFDSGADGGYVNFWVQAYTDLGSATVADNIVTITGGDGTDYVSGYLYAYSYDYYNNNSGNSAVTDNNVTADLGAGADTLDFYFYAYSNDYYSNSDDDILSVTGNALTAFGGTGSDTLRVHFYRYDYDGSSEISISGNSAMLDGGADADYLYAYLQEGTEGNVVSLVGGSGNDTFFSSDQGSNTRLFIGGAGNDTITDQEGQSTAQFGGAKINYSIVINGDGSITVTDLRSGSPDGTDTLWGVDVLRFSNGDFLPDGTRISGNSAPVGTDDSYAVDEDGILTIAATGVLANDTDDDEDALTAILVDGPTNGTLTLNANGSFDYTPDANYNGPDSFTYRANDGEEDGNLVTVSITINSVNDTPDAPSDTDPAGDAGTASATLAEDHAIGAPVGITATAADIDAGDVVTFDLGLDGDGNRIFDDGTFAIDSATGVVSLSGALNYEDASSHTLRIYATDGLARSFTDFVVNVTNVAPTAPTDSDSGTNVLGENAAAGTYSGLTAASTDPNGATLSYTLTNNAGGRFAINSTTGAITATGTGNLDYETAAVDGIGHYYDVTARASDGTDNSGSTTFRIYLTNVVEHLFTPNDDGTGSVPINFNTLADGAYDFDGAQYDALAGNDFVYLPNLAAVDAGNPWDYNRTFNASAGNDVVQGGDGNDIISGGDGGDRLFGAAGDDRLVGSSGDDILAGGDGSDKLTGSSGRDIFIFTDSEFGTTRLGEHDTITDFQQGTDKIDISALYDGGLFGGIQSGTATQAANASGYKVYFFSDGGKTWIMGDTNGVAGADFAIEISGSYKLKGTDFIASASFVSSQAQWSSATGGLDYLTHHQDYFF